MEEAKGVMYLTFYAYGIQSLSCDVHHSRLALSSTTGTLFRVCFFLFSLLIIRTLKQDDLAGTLSTTSLTELDRTTRVGMLKTT